MHCFRVSFRHIFEQRLSAQGPNHLYSRGFSDLPRGAGVMSEYGNVDNKNRRFRIGATTVVGGIGAAAAAVPFAMSFWPSERAKAAGAPVEQDIGKLEPGQQIKVEWRGKVV